MPPDGFIAAQIFEDDDELSSRTSVDEELSSGSSEDVELSNGTPDDELSSGLSEEDELSTGSSGDDDLLNRSTDYLPQAISPIGFPEVIDDGNLWTNNNQRDDRENFAQEEANYIVRNNIKIIINLLIFKKYIIFPAGGKIKKK